MIILLIALCLASCGGATRKGVAVVYFSDGYAIDGKVFKPRFEGCFAIFETENALQAFPGYRIWEVQWIAEKPESKVVKLK